MAPARTACINSSFCPVSIPRNGRPAAGSLDIPRARAAELGRTAVQAAETGVYTSAEGHPVRWQSAVAQAVAAKRSLPPDAVLPVPAVARNARTSVQVVNETTLAAARRLVDAGEWVLALNFANGIQPGGGFLSGAHAQEEVLCRSSALYATLRADPMCAAHAARTLPDSTDWAILSPDVPVFGSDDVTALPSSWLLSVVTCAAPYAPGIGQPRAGDLLAGRIRRVMAIARADDYSALVLGAWDCGAFGNDLARALIINPPKTARAMWIYAHKTTFCKGLWSRDLPRWADL